MPDRSLTATRITFLELGDERRMVREGHALLDEKRMLLAAEILAGLRRYRGLRERWLATLREARAALAAAVARHGLDGLTTHPGRLGALGSVGFEDRRLLGLHLVEARLAPVEAPFAFPTAETSTEIASVRAPLRRPGRAGPRNGRAVRLAARDVTRLRPHRYHQSHSPGHRIQRLFR